MARKTGKALVVGAGISGIRAALDLAETGYGVTLIDRAPHIGGILSQLDHQFPTNHCGMCKLLPLVKRDQSSQFCLRKGLFHENIDIRLNTQITAIDGEPGKFSVSLKHKPTWIDPERCMGCGECTVVCPVDVPDEFNQGLSLRKAIYLPVPHTIPNPYVIDLAACTNCGECAKVCPTDAIQLAFEKRKAFRILVVDDEQIVRDSLKDWLEEEGYSVDSAESGSDAMEKLGREHFNLMLTDIKMPGMDGVALLEKAAETFPELCILMMTAYATVETAVEAMKIGARDYLMKPFDPEDLVAKVTRVYEDLEAGDISSLDVGSIVFCGGTDYFDPADGKNVYGYGTIPHVVTSLEMERIFSGTGPSGGKLVRPFDGKPVRSIAWLQCVGSRDIQCDADFCSSICCMYAIKEALLAKKHGGDQVDTALFYMDMRTFEKSFERYRETAENTHNVRFERARVHSVSQDKATEDPAIRYVRTDGSIKDEIFDLVVLSVGQRPASGGREIADLTGMALNPWGFAETGPFTPAATNRPGLVVGGSFSGLKDISESVIHASAASLEASRVIHAAGGSLAIEQPTDVEMQDLSREIPRILVALCTCGDRLSKQIDFDQWSGQLEKDPHVARVVSLQNACTRNGWEELTGIARKIKPNRILLGACHPYLFTQKLKELGQELLLDPALMDVVDIMSTHPGNRALSGIKMALSRLKNIDPPSLAAIEVHRKALVVGGGVAGMHAALAIADHGYPVVLVERGDELGGNLVWLNQTIEGYAIRPLLKETLEKVTAHPLVEIHSGTTVTDSFGEVGNFYTTLTDNEGGVQTIQHATAILATGGGEAKTQSYGHGEHPAVVTQKELESKMGSEDFAVDQLNSIVMIQCVDSREEPRNYCSRVCCPTSLKHALELKRKKPDIAVYILYRDMMTPGFSETYFTKARRAGIIFIQYDPDNKPEVDLPADATAPLYVKIVDPLLDQLLEIRADMLVLATGIVPQLSSHMAGLFGVERDQDGFFQEADSKWRPVDALKEGVFACGITLSPRPVLDSIASADAASQRSLRILSHERLPAGKIVATVRHSICSLCERCIDTCPYGARSLDTSNDRVLVNPVMCQGCGDCATVCPNSAAVVQGFAERQVMGMIDAAFY